MATEIILTDKAKLSWNGDSWQPVIFKEGGKECRNPSTGEPMVTKDKWDTHACYYSDIKVAIRYIARQQCLEKEEYKSLQEYLQEYEKNVKLMLKAV